MVFVAGPEHLPPEAPPVDPLGGAQRLGVVPLKIAGEVLGSALFAARQWGPPWAPLLARRFQLIGEVLANALHRARMDREAAEKQAFEALLSRMAARLVAADTDSIDAAMEEAVEALREGLGTLRLSVAWLDVEHRMIRLLYSAGAAVVLERGKKVSLEAFSRRAAREILEGQTSVVSVEEVEPWVAEAWRPAGGGCALGVPLRVGGATVGLLAMLDRTPERYTEEFRRRVELVAQVVAHVLARRDAELAQRAAIRELQELKAKAERERDYLQEELHQTHDPQQIIGESPAFQRVLAAVAAVAPTDAAVLVHGETGVGKELVARAIHARSRRAERPLVKVNCAAIPRELFESEFFGHVKGSFSSALRDRQGRFELADKGTLFLDEVGELPLEMQSKLLRVLQEGEFERVGDDRTRKVDVRVIAATNRDLARDARAGKFRLDLYYRLSVFPVEVPPLRKRTQDILPLARHFLRRYVQALGRPRLSLSPQDEELLLHYHWPGNVRELAHLIERSVILSPGPPLRLELTPQPVLVPSTPPPAPSSPVSISSIPPSVSISSIPPSSPAPAAPSSGKVKTAAQLKELERANIQAALEQSGGQIGGKGGAAELLGLSPSTLRDRMKALGLEASRGPRRRG
jgi:transcriptional regulator with GAF, ATPase, and Fis domain